MTGTSHRFQEIYSDEHSSKATLWKNVAASVSCTKQCLEEQTETEMQEEFTSRDAIVLTAAAWGHVDVLEWLRTECFNYKDHYAFEFAALWGETSVLKWAESKGLNWYSKGVLVNAVENGHVGTFEWAHETSGRANHAVLLVGRQTIASGQGDIAMLSCMKKHNLLGDGKYLWHYAARSGHIEVLDWLGDNGFEFTDDLPLSGACCGFQEEVFSWASQRGINWKNEATCALAALYGNLPCLQWLRENDCPWDGRVIRTAQRRGHDDIVQGAINNGCPTATE